MISIIKKWLNVICRSANGSNSPSYIDDRASSVGGGYATQLEPLPHEEHNSRQLDTGYARQLPRDDDDDGGGDDSGSPASSISASQLRPAPFGGIGPRRYRSEYGRRPSTLLTSAPNEPEDGDQVPSIRVESDDNQGSGGRRRRRRRSQTPRQQQRTLRESARGSNSPSYTDDRSVSGGYATQLPPELHYSRQLDTGYARQLPRDNDDNGGGDDSGSPASSISVSQLRPAPFGGIRPRGYRSEYGRRPSTLLTSAPNEPEDDDQVPSIRVESDDNQASGGRRTTASISGTQAATTNAT